MRILITVIFITFAFGACKNRGAEEYSGLTAANGHLPNTNGLEVRDGFVEFIQPDLLKPFLEARPKVDDPEVQSLIYDKDTMWYSDNSMIFAYQDSQESVVGIRANTVGYQVGMNNQSIPGIHRLVHYFEPKGFKFPFLTTAGTDDSPNVKVLTIWRPAKASTGKVMPVVYWKPNGQRGRWRWVFPNGTYFGEMLYMKNPQGKWICFEVRTRKRYADGWEVNLFRPFTTAEGLAEAIKKKRPNWKSKADLKTLVEHLGNSDTMTTKTLASVPYKKIFDPIVGGFDVIPGIEDSNLITELLTETKFESQEGMAWKSNGKLETYAPSTEAIYHVVPKNYTAGMLAVNEVSCGRCHEDTGRRVGELELNVSLYGEIWGEDRIFSWHLFKPTTKMYGTFDQSREINPRFVKSGLVQFAKPQGETNPFYKILPLRYKELVF